MSCMTHRLFRTVAPTLLIALPALAAAGEPLRVGTVRTLSVLSVCLAVGSTGKDVKQAVYTPPPGWYIRSHRIEGLKRYGLASYTVSTVPANWQWSSDEQLSEAARLNATGNATTHTIPVGGGQLLTANDRTSQGRQHSSSSHHALVVEAVAAGSGFLRSGASIELTVTAEMIYLGRQ